MKFSAAALEGIWLVDSVPHADSRGSFARILCEEEFAENGLPGRFVQGSISQNRVCGTLRGLHFQWPPSREGKLVRCVAGAVFDVVVDLRPDSRTLARHFTVELSAENARAIYIPHGFAHGFQTLADESTVLYHMTAPYVSGLDGGYRFDDEAFGIVWPLAVAAISARDGAAVRFEADAHRAEYDRRARAALTGETSA